MYTLRVTCTCGAVFELEFNLDMASRSESMYNKFLEAHKNCGNHTCKCNHDDSDSDPLSADPTWLDRLDEHNESK